MTSVLTAALIFCVLAVLDANRNERKLARLFQTALERSENRDAMGAAELLEEALLVHPEHADSYYNLGDARAAMGQHSEAVRCFQRYEGS